MKVIKWLDNHFEESILIFLLAVISVVELVQVIARNLPFISALSWAEELCRFAWIVTVFLSLAYTIRTESTLKVTAIADILPWKVHNVLNIVIDFFQVAVLGFMSYYAVVVLQRIYAGAETSPAMGLPMWIMYLIILIGFILATVRSFQMGIIHIRNVNVKPKSTVEQQAELEAEAEKRNLEQSGGPATLETATANEGSDA